MFEQGPDKIQKLIPRLVFGSSQVEDSIWEGDREKKQIIYLAGKMVVIRQLGSQKTRLIKLSENVKSIHFFGVSPDQKNLIVSETLSNDSSLALGIYSLRQNNKRLFRITASAQNNYFRLFDFAQKDPHLVLLLSRQNEIYVMDLNRLRHISYFNLGNQQLTCIKICPFDSYLVSVNDKNSFQLYKVQQYTLKPLNPIKGLAKYKFTKHVWGDNGLFVGTEQGKTLWITNQNGNYQIQSQLPTQSIVVDLVVKESRLVTLGSNNKMILWQSDYKNNKIGVQYEAVRTWNVSPGRFNVLKSLIATSNLEQIIMGFQDSSIGIVNVQQMCERGPVQQELQIQYLHKGSHSGSISSVHTCIHRPIVVSVSRIDRSLRVWNYKLNRCDVVKYYTDKNDSQIECVDVHPSGYYLALGFSDKLKIVHLMHNLVKDYKEILLKGVDLVKFSDSGAYLCVNSIKPTSQPFSWELLLFNSYTLQIIHTFADWSSPVVSLRFCRKDTTLVAMCSSGSIKFCKINQEITCTRIVSRSSRTFTSMAIYEPLDYKNNKSLSVFSCSPLPKRGCTIRQYKQVAKKYVQRLTQVKQYTILSLQLFYNQNTESYRLLAGCEEGFLILYKIPFDNIPLKLINIHGNRIRNLVLSSCQSLIFSGCDNGVLIGSTIQSQRDVESLPKAKAIEDELSDIMLVHVGNLVQTEQKNKKLTIGLNQVQYRSMEIQNELKSKFETKINDILQAKNKQIQQIKQQLKKHVDVSKTQQIKQKEQISNVENKNLMAVSQLEALYQRKIYLVAQENDKLKRQMVEQEQNHKDQLKKLGLIHQQNTKILTQQFKEMLGQTAGLYRKQNTRKQNFQKGYVQKLRVIDEEYQQQIQRLVTKHNRQDDAKAQIIAKLNNQVESLKLTIKALNEEVFNKDRTNSILKQQIEELERLIKVRDSDLKEMEQQMIEKQVFVTENNGKMSEMREKYKEVQKKRSILNVKAAEWKQALQPRQIEIERLKNKLFQLQGQLDILVNKESINIKNIEALENEKNRLNKTIKQQATQMKNIQSLNNNIIIDIKYVLDRPKESNRSYHDQMLGLYRKYQTGKIFHGATVEGLGEINRHVMQLQRTLDIETKATTKTIQIKKKQLTKRSAENNELIKDINEYKVRYKEQALELKGKQKIIEDLKNQIKQSARKSVLGQRTPTKQLARGIARSISVRTHKVMKGSNYQPSTISSHQKDKLVQLASENELLRQYITKLQSKQAATNQRIMKHVKICEAKDKLYQLVNDQ